MTTTRFITLSGVVSNSAEMPTRASTARMPSTVTSMMSRRSIRASRRAARLPAAATAPGFGSEVDGVAGVAGVEGVDGVEGVHGLSEVDGRGWGGAAGVDS